MSRGLESGFIVLRSRRGARRRQALVSCLAYEGKANSCPSTKSGRRFDTGLVLFGIDVTMDSPLAEVAVRSGLLSTEDSVEAECVRLLGKLD